MYINSLAHCPVVAHSQLYKEFLEYSANMGQYYEESDTAYSRMTAYDREQERIKIEKLAALAKCESSCPDAWACINQHRKRGPLTATYPRMRETVAFPHPSKKFMICVAAANGSDDGRDDCHDDDLEIIKVMGDGTGSGAVECLLPGPFVVHLNSVSILCRSKNSNLRTPSPRI